MPANWANSKYKIAGGLTESVTLELRRRSDQRKCQPTYFDMWVISSEVQETDGRNQQQRGCGREEGMRDAVQGLKYAKQPD